MAADSKETASEQVLKISITPEPSPTPAPDTVDAAAVTSNGDISMVNLYLAENPSAVTNSTDTGAGDANTTDASNMQNQDQSEDTSGSSDEGGDLTKNKNRTPLELYIHIPFCVP